MKINYKEINKRYNNLLKEYRQVTESVKNKDKAQLLQRMDNKNLDTETEHEVMFCDFVKNNLEWNHKPMTFLDKSYTFVNFKNTKIGKQAVLSEDDMFISSASFWNVTFTDCIFQNIIFKNCRFMGCKFVNCKTEELGIIFENCFFEKTSVGHNKSGEFETYIVSTEFINCWITNVKFRECDLASTIWENCTFILTSYNQCSVKDSIFSACGFYSTVFNDSDIAGIGILKMKKADLQFYGNYKDSEFHESTYIDLMDYKDNEQKKQKRESAKKSASELSKMYYTLLNCLKSKNSDIVFLSEYRYQYQKYHMIAKEKWYMQIWDRVSWAICGFGERTGKFTLWLIS